MLARFINDGRQCKGPIYKRNFMHWYTWGIRLAQWILSLPFTSVDTSSNFTSDQSLACGLGFQSYLILLVFLYFWILQAYGKMLFLIPWCHYQEDLR